MRIMFGDRYSTLNQLMSSSGKASESLPPLVSRTLLVKHMRAPDKVIGEEAVDRREERFWFVRLDIGLIS